MQKRLLSPATTAQHDTFVLLPMETMIRPSNKLQQGNITSGSKRAFLSRPLRVLGSCCLGVMSASLVWRSVLYGSPTEDSWQRTLSTTTLPEELSIPRLAPVVPSHPRAAMSTGATTMSQFGGESAPLDNVKESHFSHTKVPDLKDSTIHDDDIHYSHISILGLNDWERKSLEGISEQQEAIESCQPPEGIPPQCCIGTFGGMGRIIPNRRHQCGIGKNQTTEDYMAVRDAAQNEMQQMTNSGGCDVCRLLDTLQRKNWTMAFLGDSVSHQTFQGFVCELYRRNYNVTESSTSFRYQPQRTRNQRRGQQRHQADDTQDSSIHQQTDNVECSGINHCLHLVRQIQVTSPLWKTSGIGNDQPPVVTIKFFHQYRIPFERPEQEELVISSADVLVLNFGLHWGANYDSTDNTSDTSTPPNQEKERGEGALPTVTSKTTKPTPNHLQHALTDLLRKIANRGRVQRLFFRETTAQHFDADGGDYSFVKQQHQKLKQQRQQRKKQAHLEFDEVLPQEESLQCVPHQRGPTAGWREHVVLEAVHSANFTVVRHPKTLGDIAPTASSTSSSNMAPNTIMWIPYFDFTKKFSNLHPQDSNGSNAGDDCTHYCSSPFLYMPLWTSLRLYLEF